MIEHLFILIPANTPTGPVKGAFALANAVVGQCKVTLVTIKHGAGANAWLDPRVHTLCLADCAQSLVAKTNYYRKILSEASEYCKVSSLSLCMSADLLNLFCKGYASTCSSVRGNLFVNYRYDYGVIGIGLAFFHLFSLRWIDRVAAMNQSMGKQIKRYSGHTPFVIGNFIDEAQHRRSKLLKNDSDSFIFLFVGSLTSRKQPVLLITALKELHMQGVTARVEYVGAGPERQKVDEETRKLGLLDFVQCHGFLSEPEVMLASADVLVLPSLSEGISRAALEALYLGIPCVLRDVDGNRELLIDGVNGAVFADDRDLPDAMLRAAKISRKNKNYECLLPLDFRQHVAVLKYMQFIGIIDE